MSDRSFKLIFFTKFEVVKRNDATAVKVLLSSFGRKRTKEKFGRSNLELDVTWRSHRRIVFFFSIVARSRARSTEGEGASGEEERGKKRQTVVLKTRHLRVATGMWVAGCWNIAADERTVPV